MKVKEVEDLVGISVRTIHHYDHIRLLTPETTTDSGYRIYSDHNLETLQQILFFRELDFPLKKIKEVIYSPSFNREEALEMHRRMLLKKRSQLDKMIQTIEDRKSTRLNSSHVAISYAVFCLKKKKNYHW